MNNKVKQSLLLLIAMISLLVHLLPGLHFEYHRDELLYFSLGSHLDFGYATTPPLIGLIAFASKSIFGSSVFAARIIPALMSGLLVYLTSMMAKELNGRFRAQMMAAIGVAGSMFLVMIYGVFTPYCFDIFFWTLALYLIIRYTKTQKGGYILALGLVLGFSFLNKYSILFLVASVLVVLPFTNHRVLFSHKTFYQGLFLALLVASPNIIWQAVHHFPVINHMKELNVSQLSNVNRYEFAVEQLIFLLPFTLIVLPGLVSFLVSARFRNFRFLIAISAVVVILFLFFRGKSFYTSGLFPFLIVVGSLFVEKVIVNRYAFLSTLGLLMLISTAMLPLVIPMFRPETMVNYFDGFAKITHSDLLRKDEDGQYRKLPQVFADMQGWEEISDITRNGWNRVENKNNCLIFCANYGQAGAISMIGKKYGLPEPYSFSDTYKFWFPDQFKNDIVEVLYVIGEDAMDSGNFKDTKDFFEEMIEIGTVKNRLAIEYNTKVYLFKKPRNNFNLFWKEQTRGI